MSEQAGSEQSSKPEESLTPQVMPDPTRMESFARNAVSHRLRMFGQYLNDGLTPSEAAAKAGYSSAASAISSLARVEFTINLRQALNDKGLDVDRLAEEIDWGLKKTVASYSLKTHVIYIAKLMEALREAHPEDAVKETGNKELNVKQNDTFEKFLNYIKTELPEGEARSVTKAIRRFIENPK